MSQLFVIYKEKKCFKISQKEFQLKALNNTGPIIIKTGSAQTTQNNAVRISEAINGRSPIIENQTIQAKYSTTNRCVEKHIYNNIYGLIKDTGLYNRNKVLRFILYDLYKRTKVPAYWTCAPHSSIIRRKYCPFIEVINYKPEDFISTIT